MSDNNTNKKSLYDLLKSSKYPESFFTEYIKSNSASRSILTYVSLELTPVCNFNCEMCYIRRTEQEVIRSGDHVMSFEEWKPYIDELIDMNVSYFTLSGGECTIHPDFIRIYEYIYQKGGEISLITNASCMTENIFDLFLQMPPRQIYITLYGTNSDIYERLCENRDAFDKVIKNIDRLLELKMPVSLQTTISQLNADDFDNIVKFASERKKYLYHNEVLSIFDKCDNTRLDNTQIDTFDFIKRQFSVNEIDYYGYEFPKINTEPNKGLNCTAARCACSFSWKGIMRPCVSFEPFVLDPRKEGGIKKCWERLSDWGSNVSVLTECQTCIFKKECAKCPAIHYNDTHEYGKPSPRLCFKVQHPKEAAKLQAEYDRRQAEKAAAESNNVTKQGDL